MARRNNGLTFGIALLFAASTAHAGYVSDSADLAREIFNQNVNPASETANTSTGSGPMGAGGTTINVGSNVGKNSQDAGAAANNAAGAALIATGSALLPNPPTAPTGAMLIALGVLALMQGAHDSDASDQSAATAAASALRENPGAAPYGTGTSAFKDPKVKQAIKQLNDNGYKVTAAGITKPDGSFIPASSLSSPGAMAAAGIDPSAVKEVQKVNAAISDELGKYNARVAGLATAEGGGGGVAREFTPGDTESEEIKVFNPFALNADQKKQLMAGKTVNLDGDPIGVAGANIFDMVHQAYQKKRTGAQFFESEEGSVGVRSPASIKKGSGRK